MSGIWVTEDLIYEDRLRKKQVKDVMKSAYEAGKKPVSARVNCTLMEFYTKDKLFFMYIFLLFSRVIVLYYFYMLMTALALTQI